MPASIVSVCSVDIRLPLAGPRMSLAGVALTCLALTRLALTHAALTRVALTHVALTHVALTHVALTHVALTHVALIHALLLSGRGILEGPHDEEPGQGGHAEHERRLPPRIVGCRSREVIDRLIAQRSGIVIESIRDPSHEASGLRGAGIELIRGFSSCRGEIWP